MTDYFKNKASDWDSPAKVAMSGRFVEEMVRNVKFNKSVKAMDLGCGTGLVGLSILNDIKSLILVDNSRAMIDKLKEKIEVIEHNNETTLKEKVKIITGSVEKYTADDLDVVFSLMALHHIENIDALFEHISKILKPGGILVIGDLCEEDGSFHGEESVPHNGFNIESLSKQIEAYDIDIVKTYTYNKIKKNDREYDQFIIIAKKS